MIFARLLLLLALLPGLALAEAPLTSPRPLARPEAGLPPVNDAQEAVRMTAISLLAPARAPRPLPRPWSAAVAAGPARVVPGLPETAPAAPRAPVDPITAFIDSLSGRDRSAEASALAVARAPRPAARPAEIARRAAGQRPPKVPVGPDGSICGVPEIKGEAIADIPGPGACGVSGAVRVSSVAGIPLSMKPTIDCDTARALNAWVRDGVIPAVGRTGGGLARLNIVAHYACRPRNNQRGAKLSEHGKGRAIDVSGVTFKDGTTITLIKHWSSGSYGPILKAMHKSACGPFGTVLGPNADRYHQDHLHMDTARYRSGSYCR